MESLDKLENKLGTHQLFLPYLPSDKISNNFMEVTFTTLADFSTKIILLVVKAKISMVTDVKNVKQKWKKSKPT